MSFVRPMLAHKLKDKSDLEPDQWVAEEKFDGHRIVVHKSGSDVMAWSRYGNVRPLPVQILQEIQKLPDGTYDGEMLAPGKRSYGVTELTNVDELVYIVFDVVAWNGRDLFSAQWSERRRHLEDILWSYNVENAVQLSHVYELSSREHLTGICQAIWDRDGEGVIVKRKSGLYIPGSRSRDWLKEKMLQTELVTVIGYVDGLMGPYSRVQVVSDSGVKAKVKTRNTRERERLEANPHAFIGKKLWIEFQETTPKGYRHPRWDRWEDE